MAETFGGKNIWLKKAFGVFTSLAVVLLYVYVQCSLAVEILADCSQNCQTTKISSHTVFFVFSQETSLLV